MSLFKIQSELKAPKGQINKFGNYKYRSCEDIIEAAKPILAKYEVYLLITDEIVLVGDRYYVKATATLSGKDINVSVSAYAREPLSKKGMDEAQITGATSSYARKYALNGLFAIDDTKDADTMDNSEKPLDNGQVSQIKELIKQSSTDENKFLAYFKVDSIDKLPYDKAIQALNNKIKKAS